MIEILQQKEDNKKALVWANKAKELYPKSKFINNIKNKENQIKNPQLNIFYENETQANKPIHVVVEGKNVQQFSLNIYEVKDDTQGFLNYVFDSYNTPFAKVKKSLVRKDQFTLPESFDFKTHKTSLELKALPAGIYLAEYVVENSVQRNFYFIVSDSKIIFSKKDALRPFDKLKELPGDLSYAQTEPIADYIMKYTSGKDVTPEGYRKATISEGEPTAADLAAFTKAIKDHKVDLLIFNPQTETDTAGRIKSAAEDADVNIVEIGETPPDGKEFWTYYDEVTDSLGKL